jgi:GDP-D-mannose dehydratase
MKIIVTGILGQDGANMVEYLLKNTDSKIFGMIRRTSNPNFVNCKSFIKNVKISLEKILYKRSSSKITVRLEKVKNTLKILLAKSNLTKTCSQSNEINSMHRLFSVY